MSRESNLKQIPDAWQGKDKDELNSIFDSISDAGLGMKVTVKERAFKKENILTFCPPEMYKIGDLGADGSVTFTIPSAQEILGGAKRLSIHAVEMGIPYIVIYGEGCAYEAYFNSHDIEKIEIISGEKK